LTEIASKKSMMVLQGIFELFWTCHGACCYDLIPKLLHCGTAQYFFYKNWKEEKHILLMPFSILLFNLKQHITSSERGLYMMDTGKKSIIGILCGTAENKQESPQHWCWHTLMP